MKTLKLNRAAGAVVSMVVHGQPASEVAQRLGISVRRPAKA
jgi:DNA-binding CsgD family transcriptional regulator